jgi:hypothetical protein
MKLEIAREIFEEYSNIEQSNLPLKMVPICCPETPVINRHSTMRNIPEGRISHLHHGGSFKSDKVPG